MEFLGVRVHCARAAGCFHNTARLMAPAFATGRTLMLCEVQAFNCGSRNHGPPKPSSLVRFFPVSQYLLELASGL